MPRLFSHKHRPVHLGAFPLENLPRKDSLPEFQRGPRRSALAVEDPANPHSLANGMREYINVMDRMRVGPVAPQQAPIPQDLQERANHLKAACYYLDASMAGTCRIPSNALLAEPVVNTALGEAMELEYGAGSADNPMAEISVREGKAAWERAQAEMEAPPAHDYALVILSEHTRDVDPVEPGAEWLVDTQPQRAALRAAEVGAVMANYLRMLGFDARLHTATASDLDMDMDMDMEQILLASGLGELPFSRKWIAELDDKVGNGKINPVKKWWWDLDTDDEGNAYALSSKAWVTTTSGEEREYRAQAVPWRRNRSNLKS